MNSLARAYLARRFVDLCLPKSACTLQLHGNKNQNMKPRKASGYSTMYILSGKLQYIAPQMMIYTRKLGQRDERKKRRSIQQR